jgi:hypothetical protein
MKNEIRTINWTMKNGWNATITVAHVTSEDINADGHIVNVKCDRVATTLEIADAKIVERDFYLTTNVTPKAAAAGAYATIETRMGVIGIPKDVFHETTSAVEEFTPKREAVEEVERGFGWCEKCGSYCYGDCEA